MADIQASLRGVIFDYGNTLIWLGPQRRSTRTDYADIVARPGAMRLARYLLSQGALDARDSPTAFVERYLDIRERNRIRAEETGREITARESLVGALESHGARVPADEVLRSAVAESFGPEIEAIEPLPGAGETLERLRERGVSLGLLSNCTDGAYVREVVRRLGWLEYFEPVVVSADIVARKPHPEAFHAVVDRWALGPGEIAMVGDSLYHDVAGAERLGMRTIHFTAIENPGDSAHSALIRPRWAVSSHVELRRVLIPLLA